MKTITLFLLSMSAAFGQAAPKSKSTKITESPEHRLYRTQIGTYVQKCDELVTLALSIIDKGRSTHSAAVVCVVDDASVDFKDRLVNNLLNNMKAQIKAQEEINAQIGSAPCEGCANREDLEYAKNILEDSKIGNARAKEISDMRETLKMVDSCVSVYRKTIDKKGSDLTMRESEQVKACQHLDLYPPAK